MHPQIRKIATTITRPTWKRLLGLTPRAILERGNHQCHVIRKQYAVGNLDNFKRTYTKNKTHYNEMRGWIVCTDGKRNTYIRFYGPPKPDTQVWVWCSCNYFLFHLEYTLARLNASTIRNSNGQRPTLRRKQVIDKKTGKKKWVQVGKNVRLIPHLCKHLVMLGKLALQEKRDLAAEQIEEIEKEASVAKMIEARMTKPNPFTRTIPKGRFTTPFGTHKNIR